jgi:hypothetical protein
MSLINLTPREYKIDFKLEKGNAGSIGATKITRLSLPENIDIQKGHTIIAYDANVYITFTGISSAANAIGKSKQSISSVALGKRPTSHGYFWKYLNKT